MPKLILKKGNLFNPLENKIDKLIIDSSQYDLKTTCGTNTTYYRIRYISPSYKAKQITPTSFHIPKYNKNSIPIKEVEQFHRTYLFHNQFPYYSLFQREFYKNNNSVSSYYAFLQRVTGKNNINNSTPLYSFSIPAIGTRQKNNILSYDIEIELIRNRFYIVFIKENRKIECIKKEEPQYIIYEKQDFLKAKDILSESIIDLAIVKNYPLNLLEYIYLMTNKDNELISQFFQTLTKIHNLNELYTSPLFQWIEPNLTPNNELTKELTKYLNQEQKDINYSYNNKKLILKK